METVLVTIIVMALILFAIPTLVSAALEAQDTLAQDWQALQQTATERADTSLDIIEIDAQDNTIDVVIQNGGKAKLCDWENWDLVLQYYAPPSLYEIFWVPYVTAEHESNWWRVLGIYMDAEEGTTEVYEPGILNPGEQLIIRVSAAPALEAGSAAQITLSTPNAATASAAFVCQ